MALIWKRQHFDRGESETSSGFSTDIVWHVRFASPSVARADAGSPHRGDTHFDYPDLRANSVLFSPAGFGTEVTVQYVPKEFLDRPPPEDITDEEFTKSDSYSENRSIEIPVFQLTEKQFPILGGGVETKSVWQRLEHAAAFEYAVSYFTITLNATVDSGFGVSTLLALTNQARAQMNKIHLIDGERYLFVSSSSRKLKTDLYQFTYKWLFDPGVKDTRVYDQSLSPSFGRIGSYGYPREALTGPHTGFVIGPYRRIDTSPHGNDPTLAPLVRGVDAYEEDLTGHLTLPGVTL